MRLFQLSLAVLTIAWPMAASAQTSAEAKRFVADLYGAYRGGGPDYLGRQAPSVFAPPLLALLRRAAAATPPGDAPDLDGDPICDCQDFDISQVRVRVVLASARHARATVRFRNFAQPQTVRLDLAAQGAHWRVSDVHTATSPSLIALLKRSLDHTHLRG